MSASGPAEAVTTAAVESRILSAPKSQDRDLARVRGDASATNVQNHSTNASRPSMPAPVFFLSPIGLRRPIAEKRISGWTCQQTWSVISHTRSETVKFPDLGQDRKRLLRPALTGPTIFTRNSHDRRYPPVPAMLSPPVPRTVKCLFWQHNFTHTPSATLSVGV